MEIGTGASTSLINHDTFIELFSNASILTSRSCRIHTYTGEVVKPIGEAEFIGERHYMKNKVKLGRII